MSNTHRFKVGDKVEESFVCVDGPLAKKRIYWRGKITSLEVNPANNEPYYRIDVTLSNEPSFPRVLMVADAEDFHSGNGIPLRLADAM